jgi:hypothetical protein
MHRESTKVTVTTGLTVPKKITLFYRKKQYGSRLLKPAKPLLNGHPGKNSKLGSTANQVAPVADIPEVQIEVIVHSFLIQNHSISIKNKSCWSLTLPS